MYLKPTPGLDQRQTVNRAHLVHHRRGRERFDDTSAALAIHDEMMQQQADDLVRGKIIAAAIHAANAVGIAVRHEADVVRMLAQIFLARSVIFLDRFGIDAAEHDIMRAIERGDFAGRAAPAIVQSSRRRRRTRRHGRNAALISR